MSLPPEVQEHVDKIRELLGVPACQLQIDIDRDGVVQDVKSMQSFKRRKADRPPVLSEDPKCCGVTVMYRPAYGDFQCRTCKKTFDRRDFR